MNMTPSESQTSHSDYPSWTWWPERGRLRIDASETGPLRRLAGEWTQEALRHMLDGLSGARMREALVHGAGGEIINLALALKDGLRVQLIGAYVQDGVAHGILVPETAIEDAPHEAEHDAPPLIPVFQPIFRASDGGLAGFEALARWTGPGGIDPRRFEEAGLASNMLLRAADLAEALQAAGSAPYVAFNIMSGDVLSGGFADLAAEVMAARKLPPGALVAELTEHAALRRVEDTVAGIEALNAAGLRVALDDFGAGQSSFLWLIDMPVAALKLDADLTARRSSDKGTAVIGAISALAKDLDLTLTAEGIEDEAAAEEMGALGADYLQGFGLSRPLDFDAAVSLAQARPAVD